MMEHYIDWDNGQPVKTETAFTLCRHQRNTSGFLEWGEWCLQESMGICFASTAKPIARAANGLTHTGEVYTETA